MWHWISYIWFFYVGITLRNGGTSLCYWRNDLKMDILMKNLKDKLILLENHFVLSLSSEELDAELVDIKAKILTEIVLIKHLLARGDNGKTEIN